MNKPTEVQIDRMRILYLAIRGIHDCIPEWPSTFHFDTPAEFYRSATWNIEGTYNHYALLWNDAIRATYGDLQNRVEDIDMDWNAALTTMEKQITNSMRPFVRPEDKAPL